jgi:hypothetical protein
MVIATVARISTTRWRIQEFPSLVSGPVPLARAAPNRFAVSGFRAALPRGRKFIKRGKFGIRAARANRSAQVRIAPM